MHILITNDDGPPSAKGSPYVHCLVRHLQKAGHVVSVCLPHTQRSWIGKAYMIGDTLKPVYYRPGKQIHGDFADGTLHEYPSSTSDVEEWILMNGTPASCAHIGLYHFFKDKGPVDLVVSGPNFGRNTTAMNALSSGTIGAAMEAAACRKKSIALSFAYSRTGQQAAIEAACGHSVKVIEALYKQWPKDGSVDLYTVNMPLLEDIAQRKTLWTEMLQNKWGQESCFEEVECETTNDGADDSRGALHSHKHFRWAPRHVDVHRSVDESEPGNDGWAIKEGYTRYVISLDWLFFLLLTSPL